MLKAPVDDFVDNPDFYTPATHVSSEDVRTDLNLVFSQQADTESNGESEVVNGGAGAMIRARDIESPMPGDEIILHHPIEDESGEEIEDESGNPIHGDGSETFKIHTVLTSAYGKTDLVLTKD